MSIRHICDCCKRDIGRTLFAYKLVAPASINDLEICRECFYRIRDEIINKNETQDEREDNDKPKVNPELKADLLKRLHENALKQIEELKAECKWTPCSERLPNEEGYYIVTVPIRDEAFVNMMFFHKGVFCEFDDENGDVEYDDVIAWMPLPKPHEEIER